MNLHKSKLLDDSQSRDDTETLDDIETLEGSEYLDASSDPGAEDPASGLGIEPCFVGLFEFEAEHLNYILVNLKLARGINTIREVVLVLRSIWPDRFRYLQESDVQMVVDRLGPISPPKRPDLEMVIRRLCPDLQARTIVEKINDSASSKSEIIGTYVPGQALCPQRVWDRSFETQQSDSESPNVTQLANAFRFELREAEICRVRPIAKTVLNKVVTLVLASKLFSDLSSEDIALGLTKAYSVLFRGYRYVWMSPFTKKHVEIILHRSQQAQTKLFKEMKEVERGDPDLREYQEAFLTAVEAGRADLGLEARCYGGEKSSADFVQEIMDLFWPVVVCQRCLMKRLDERC